MPRGCSTARRSHTNWFRTEVDEEHLAATHVAEQLGEDIATVFKTLVLKGDRTGYFVCVVPGEPRSGPESRGPKISANKKADLIPMKELLPVTGYIRGGCSPIGMKKRFSDLHPRHGRRACLSSMSVRGCGVCNSRSPLRTWRPASGRPFAEISRKG